MNGASERYLGDKGREYCESKFSKPWDRDQKYRINFEYFSPFLAPDQTVLDFGCGNGGMLLMIRDCVSRAEGLEVNPAAREIAERAGLAVYPSLEQLPSVPTYDLVVSNHVLEHVRDVCSTLERVRLAMKPGARLVVKLPFDDIHDAHHRTWQQNDIDFHLHTFSVRNFANVLFESGFDVDSCKVITSAANPRLLPFKRVGLEKAAFWALAVLKNRRQIFAVGRVP